jgi:hypothetical protein
LRRAGGLTSVTLKVSGERSAVITSTFLFFDV